MELFPVYTAFLPFMYNESVLILPFLVLSKDIDLVIILLEKFDAIVSPTLNPNASAVALVEAGIVCVMTDMSEM